MARNRQTGREQEDGVQERRKPTPRIDKLMAKAARLIVPTVGRCGPCLGEPVPVEGDIQPHMFGDSVRLVMHWGFFNPFGPTKSSLILVALKGRDDWLLCQHIEHPFTPAFVAHGLLPSSTVAPAEPAPLLPTLRALFARNGGDGAPLLQDLPTHVELISEFGLDSAWMSRLLRWAAADLDVAGLERVCDLLERHRGDPWQRTRIELREAVARMKTKQDAPPLLGGEVSDELWNRWWSLVTDPGHVRSERDQMRLAWDGSIASAAGMFGGCGRIGRRRCGTGRA